MQRWIGKHGHVAAMERAHHYGGVTSRLSPEKAAYREELIEAGFRLGVKWDWWCTDQEPGAYD